MSFLQYFGLPAAGAGAAGAAGAAGLSAASALNPVSAGIMAAAPIASGIYGIVQKAQADKLRKQFDQPMYAIPQGMQEAYGLAQSRAFDTSLPGQSLIEAGIDRGQAAANRAIMESGLSGAERLAAINAGAGNRMDANTQLAMQMAQQQQQNLANYQNTLGQLAGYQEKQWQLNKQQPWIDAMEAANRLSEAGSQNIMTGLKDLSGIGVAMARQGEIGGEPSKGMSGVLGSSVSGITPRSKQAATPATTTAVEGTTTPPAVGATQNVVTPPAVNTTQNVATTPPAVNTAQNVVTTQPTTTATEAVTPVASTLPVQEAMNFNATAAQPIMGIDQNVIPQSPAQQFLTPVAPPTVQQSVLPLGPPTLQSFMENVPMAIPTQQVSTPARPVLTEPSPMIDPINPDFAAMGLPTTVPQPERFGPGVAPNPNYMMSRNNTLNRDYNVNRNTSLTDAQIQQIMNPTGQQLGPPTLQSFMENVSMAMPTAKGTKQMSAMPTMTQFQSASPREKLDLFSQGFGQFGLKGK